MLPKTVQTAAVVEANVTGKPDAPPVAESVRVPPAVNVTSLGWLKVIVCPIGFTVSKAAAVVAVPAELVNTARYRLLLALPLTELSESVVDVAPATLL